MLETLRAWLNGTRDYFTGVTIFAKLSDDKKLISLLKGEKSAYNVSRLEKELMAICVQLKQSSNGTDSIIPNSATSTSQERATQKNGQDRHRKTSSTPDKPVEKADEQIIANPELYQIVFSEATKKYKETMNLRAELFALAHTDGFVDINRPDLVKTRAPMALQVHQGFIEASELYDKANYVKINGRLPGEPNGNIPENEYDHLADHLVKGTLDNLRKNYNKMKNRPVTAERTALLQKHKTSIEKLEIRWLLLKK